MNKFLAKLGCVLLGHRYEVWQEFSRSERRVVCEVCGGDWAMHDGRQAFLPWDEDFTQIKRDMGVWLRPRPKNRS